MKKNGKSEYDEVEVELVMEAYGVGRTRALAILRTKLKTSEVKTESAEKAKTGRAKRTRPSFDDDMMGAEEFFGI